MFSLCYAIHYNGTANGFIKDVPTARHKEGIGVSEDTIYDKFCEVYDPGISKGSHDETVITLGERLQLKFFDPRKVKLITQIKKGIGDSFKFTEYNLEWIGYCLFYESILEKLPSDRLTFPDYVTDIEGHQYKNNESGNYPFAHSGLFAGVQEVLTKICLFQTKDT